jgi:hypothetical protein
MQILLDTNVWRYLVDSGQHDCLYQFAHRSCVQIAVAPTILLETLRLGDSALRKKIVEVQTRACWKRLMPDAYLECEDITREMLRCRPQWALPEKDTARFRKLRYDWIRGKGGFWSKARTETDAIAAQYASRDFRVLETAREQARVTRDAVLRRGQVILGSKLLAEIPGSWTTLKGEEVKTDFWRVYASAVWETVLTENSAFRQWLSCEIEVNLLLTYYASEYSDFWAYEVQANSVPRAWIRAAMYALQSERKTTDGTPTDAAIAVHLRDVDLIISADKNFVSMVNRCQDEAPFDMGRAFLIQAGKDGVDQLFDFVSNARKIPSNALNWGPKRPLRTSAL